MPEAKLAKVLSDIKKDTQSQYVTKSLNFQPRIRKLLRILSRVFFIIAILFFALSNDNFENFNSTSAYSLLSPIALLTSLTFYYGSTKLKSA